MYELDSEASADFEQVFVDCASKARECATARLLVTTVVIEAIDAIEELAAVF